MPIVFNKQTVALDGVTSVTVSDIVADEVNGGFVRRVLFYTDPVALTNRTADIELILTAEDEESLKLRTPELEY